MNLVLLDARGRELAPMHGSSALNFRASLPGARSWDRVTSALRAAMHAGAADLDLLPLALPAAWLINASVDSRVLAAWGAPECAPAWRALLRALPPELDPVEAGRLPDAVWANITAALAVLASLRGANAGAVTKVLAPLRPALLPRMDDAALALALGEPPPTSADDSKARPDMVRPYFRWFWSELDRLWDPLCDLAAKHSAEQLDAAQVLDRLVWYRAWGWKYEA